MKSFFSDAISYELVDHHILQAVLPDQNGNAVTASLDLNTGIGFDNGLFVEWSGSASPVSRLPSPVSRLPSPVSRLCLRLQIATFIPNGNFYREDYKYDPMPHLVKSTYGAMLCFALVRPLGAGDEDYYYCRVNLAQGIGNDNGHLVWVDSEELEEKPEPEERWEMYWASEEICVHQAKGSIRNDVFNLESFMDTVLWSAWGSVYKDKDDEYLLASDWLAEVLDDI
ncbi:hypothetical protein BDW74DRAFT_177715 [Aspergillus multicolor]|uniref:uncharacterized protein n=1 Tax=Aspergillus multicolor TaxID=41759 RepID=UPI003CCCE01C